MGDDEDGAKPPGRDGAGTGVVVKPKTRTKKPSMYKVLLLNDDYTPDGVRRDGTGAFLLQEP